MQNGVRDVSEQIKHNRSNYGSNNPFGDTTETRYHRDSGTPLQKGGLDKGQLDYFDDPKRGQYVQFSEDKLQSSKAKISVQITRKEIEQMKDDIAELLDFKDKGMQATPFRLMEQVTVLQNSVDALRSEVRVAESLQQKIDLLLSTKGMLEGVEDEVNRLYQSKEELHSLLHKYQKDYKKLYSIAEQAEGFWAAIKHLETWITTLRLVTEGNSSLRKKEFALIMERIETLEKATRINEQPREEISKLRDKRGTLHLRNKNEDNDAPVLRTALNRLSGIEKRLELLEDKIK